MAEELHKDTVAEQPTEETKETAPAAEDKKAADKHKDKKAEKAEKGEKKLADETKAAIEKLEKDLAESKDRLLRTAAEYENFRKRSSREFDSAFNNGVQHAVQGLLPVIDTLEMAANAPSTDDNYKKGVQMTLTKCAEALEKLGVTEIEAQDQEFDPNLHAAVMQESVEGVESGTITKVLQKGYKMGDKVVRHAAVAVAQ